MIAISRTGTRHNAKPGQKNNNATTHIRWFGIHSRRQLLLRHTLAICILLVCPGLCKSFTNGAIDLLRGLRGVIPVQSGYSAVVRGCLSAWAIYHDPLPVVGVADDCREVNHPQRPRVIFLHFASFDGVGRLEEEWTTPHSRPLLCPAVFVPVSIGAPARRAAA